MRHVCLAWLVLSGCSAEQARGPIDADAHEEICDDFSDSDRDFRIDCEDSDCADDPVCEEVDRLDPGDWRCPPPPSGDWTQNAFPEVPHVVDGDFSGGEWAGVQPVSGMFTDLYLDWAAPSLFAINDWRANEEGVRGDCYNRFDLCVDGRPLYELRVHGDGHAEARVGDRIVAAVSEGAAGFGPSPAFRTPHTIYEFRLDLEGSPSWVSVTAKDPDSLEQCEILTEEPAYGGIDVGGDRGRVARGIEGDVPWLPPGASCAVGEGLCEDGSRCVDGPNGPTCVADGPCSPRAEACNGEDDDCNGVADDDACPSPMTCAHCASGWTCMTQGGPC